MAYCVQRSFDLEIRRVRAELLGLRAEASLRRFLFLQHRYAPSQPRIPAGQPGGGRWTDGGATVALERIDVDEAPSDDGGDSEIVFVGGLNRRGGPPTVRIGLRDLEATPAQAVRFEVARAQAVAAEVAVRTIDPNWRAPSSLYETVEGGIRHEEARLLAARERLMELGNPMLRSRQFAICLTEEDQMIAWREGRANDNVVTVFRSDFSNVLSRIMEGSVEVPGPSSYPGSYFIRSDGTAFGVRASARNGVTVDLYDLRSDFPIPVGKVHQK